MLQELACRAANAFEFGVDPAYGAVDGGPWLPREPLLETLLRASGRSAMPVPSDRHAQLDAFVYLRGERCG